MDGEIKLSELSQRRDEFFLLTFIQLISASALKSTIRKTNAIRWLEHPTGWRLKL
jgi:hypothetical protein